MFVVAAVVLTASLLLPASALGDDAGQNKADTKAAAAKDGEPVVKSKVTESMKMVRKLGAAFELIDYGREEIDPTSLLVAARILGTTPVRDLKFEPGDDDKESRHKISDFDAAALEKQAQQLIAEARRMIKDLPASERAAVEELAKATALRLEERDRGNANGPGTHHGFIYPGGSGNPIVFRNVSLTGTYTEIRVRSLDGVDLDLKVVGAITGHVYAHDRAPYPNASVRFNHLPIAVVNVFLENHGNRRGEFIIYHN
jgi:hypothetical protein